MPWARLSLSFYGGSATIVLVEFGLVSVDIRSVEANAVVIGYGA
jgi:hypothetical protein